MAIIKKIFLLLTCFALLSGNATSFAASCNTISANKVEVKSQASNSEIDSPCHEKSKTINDEQQSSKKCSDCECQTCVKITGLPPKAPVQNKFIPSNQVSETRSIHSHNLNNIFQPPKYIS